MDEYIKILDMWIVVAQQRLAQDVENENYASATERQSFIAGLEQAKVLYEQFQTKPEKEDSTMK